MFTTKKLNKKKRDENFDKNHQGFEEYDVFLCHNSNDKKLVKEIAESLELDAGLLFFLDEYSIPASVEFWLFIKDQMEKSKACIIFIGYSGWGKTHIEEARFALSIRSKKPNFRIIPVNLPGSQASDWAEIFPNGYPDVNWVSIATSLPSDDELNKLRRAIVGELSPIASAPDQLTPFIIRRQAAIWKKNHKRDKSLLYKGHMLKNAIRLATSYPETVLVNPVPAFLETCINQEKLETRVSIILLFVVVIVISILGVAAYFSRETALEQRDIAMARSLAVLAKEEISSPMKNETKALLARQAYLLDKKHGNKSIGITMSSLRSLVDLSEFANNTNSPVGIVLDFSTSGEYYISSGGSNLPPVLFSFLKNGKPILEPFVWPLSIQNAKPNAFLTNKKLLIERSNGEFGILDLRNASQYQKLIFSNYATNSLFSVNGDVVAVQIEPKKIALLDMREPPYKIKSFDIKKDFCALAVSGNLSYIAFGKLNGDVEILSLGNYGLKKHIKINIGHQRVQSLSFSPNGTLLAIGGQSVVGIWKIDQGFAVQAYLETTEGSTDILAFSDSGQHLAGGSSALDTKLRIWSGLLSDNYEIRFLPNTNPISSLRFDESESKLFQGNTDGGITVWSLQNPLRFERAYK